MYIPPHYQNSNTAQSLAFIEQNNFGLLICNAQPVPLITHLPFYIEKKEPQLILMAHLAKANPHWQALQEHKECMVVFNGPHGYVSPSLYANKQNVPTWNYISVHLTCVATVLHAEEELRNIMHSTIEKAEADFFGQYNSLPADYLGAMYKAIVGIKLEVTKVESKFKLSQNKPAEDILRVAEHFEHNNNPELAAWMKKINNV